MDNGELSAILAITGTFTAIILPLYMYFKSRHAERMALIEHGQDASIFSELKGDSLGSLKWGIVAIFIGVGVMSGHFLEETMDDVAYPAMIFILGGFGLVLYYFIAKSILDKQNL